jgi:SAM-dependent methyltransferase
LNNVHPIIDRILARMETVDPINGEKMRQRLSLMDGQHLRSAAEYLEGYEAALRAGGKSIDFGVDCYLKLAGDMAEERANFLRTGRYANTSYKQVEQKIYGNPDVMEYHMHGLALAQYLWPDQYERIEFFRKGLPSRAQACKAYLEVGGGHGLYMWTALKLLPAAPRMDLLDISASSIKLAREIIASPRVNYIHQDIFEYEAAPYDFITAGEVLEHLEEPLAFLKKIYNLLAPAGTIYLTTPVNAPMIDHIYLFNHAQEIRDLVASAGLKIDEEKMVASRNLPERLIVKQKIPVMYAAFLHKA